MGDRLLNFDAHRDRNDPQKAALLLRLLWPSRDIRIACAERLARSIRYAHKQANDSWTVNMFDWRIRLNVGQVLVLQFETDEIFFYVRLARGRPEFAAVPVSSRKFQYAPAEITSIPPQHWKDHEWFISAAAEAKRSSPFKRAFSEGLMQHLERLLRTKLPRPAYLDNAATANDRSAVQSEPDLEPFDDWPAASEGRRQLFTHYRVERNRSLIERKKNAARKATGGLACEVCNFDFSTYEKLGEGFCEVHHLRPLSELASNVHTSLEDLAIVCANCHRMIHRNGQARLLSSVRASLRS
jgi:hypothetical protein